MNLKLILFASILILLVSGSASAFVFSDNFESGTVDAWTSTSHTLVNATPPNMTSLGNFYIQGDGPLNAAVIYKNGLSGITAWEFYFYRDAVSTQTTDVTYKNDEAGNTCYVEFTPTGNKISTAGTGTCAGLTNINRNMELNYLYKIDIVDTSLTETISIYNGSSGALLSTDHINKFTVTTKRITLQWNQLSWKDKIDNIIASAVPFSTSTQIAWTNTQITQGVNAPFTWSVSDTDWSTWSCGPFGILPCTWRVDEEFNDGTTDTTTTLITVGQTGSYSQYISKPGTYTLKLIKSALFVDNEVDTSSMVVNPQTSSYFNMPQSVYIKTNVNVTWHIGIGGTPTLLEWYYLDNGVEVKEDRVVLTDGVTTVLDGNINISFARVGIYNVYLKTGSVNSQILAPIQTIITSSVGGGKPSNNFLVSDIVLISNNGTGGSGGKYYFNNLIDGNYSIDAANFSHNGEFYIDVRNINASAVTLQYTGSGDTTVGINDAGTFGLVINNKPDVGLSGYWLPGDNQIRLMVRYANGSSTVLAYDTFSLFNVDESGYGLTVSPLNVIADQQVQITVTSPTAGAYITIQGNGAGITNYLKTYNFSTGTSTISTSFQTQGSYEVLLHDIAGGIHQSARITVATSVTPTPTATPNINQQTSAIADLLSSNIFWALIFTAGFMTMVAFATSHKKEP